MREHTDKPKACTRPLAAVLFLAPLVSLPKSLPMAPVLAVAAMILLIGSGWRPSRRAVLADALGGKIWLPVALLLAWVFAACWWSFNPAFSLKSLLMLVGTMAGGLVFVTGFRNYSADQQRLVTIFAAAGLGLAALAMTVVGLGDRTGWVNFGHLLWDMDSDTAVVVTLAWPVAGALARFGRPKTAAALLLLALVGTVLAHDAASKLAMLAGGVAWLAGRWRPRVVLSAIAVVAVAGSLAAPLAATRIPPPQVAAQWLWLPSSAQHRLIIWTFVTRHIAEKPVLGWGFDGARAIPGGKTHVPLVRWAGCPQAEPPIEVPGFDRPVPGDCVLWEESLPLHPHNGWLQIWLELGVVGAVITAWLLARLILPLRRVAAPSAQAFTCATLVVGLAICSVSFGIWQSWWLSTLWIAGGFLVPLLGDEAAARLGKPRGLG